MQDDKNFWLYLFNEQPPFPTINKYTDLRGYIADALQNKSLSNEVMAWWLRYKRDLKQQIINDCAELSGQKIKNAITVVVPVSPIKSHPDTKILDQCIASIRHHLKEAEIIITFDGVREEQEDRRQDYEEFIRRALFKCNTEWNATPMLFNDHTHQVGMMREALKIIESDCVLFFEG